MSGTPASTAGPSTASAPLFYNAADVVATMLTDDPDDREQSRALPMESPHGENNSASSQLVAVVAAVVAGVAVLVLVMAWVVKRKVSARASKGPRHSLRTTMVPNRGYRYSVGSPSAVERVERSRSSVSYGFGTFGGEEEEEGECPSPTTARWSTVTLDDDVDVVFEARPPLPSVMEFSASTTTTGPLTEHTVTIPLTAPTAGIVLERHARDAGTVVVGKIVPGSSAWLATDPANRAAVGDVLLGVQAVRIGRHHDLANARALLASQIGAAFRSGRAIRLVLGRPDPYA